MIKSLIPFFFQTNLSSAFPLVPFVVFVLSIFLLLNKTSFHPKPRSVSSSVIPGFNEVIVATLLIHIDTLSSMFPINHPPSSNVISLPLLYPVPDTSPAPLATPPRPLQVYTRRPHTDIGPPVDSSPMTPSSMTPVLPSPADLPIVIRKGTRSSHNPHPIYNFLTYHRLASSYYALISTLSFVSVPQNVHEVLSHSDWKHAMVEETATLHSSGTWDLVTLPVGQNTCWMSLGVYSKDWPQWSGGLS